MGRAFSPLDAELGLLGSELSPWLLEAIVRLGTWLSFEQAPAALAFFTRVAVSEETVRRWTETAGAALVAIEAAGVDALERGEGALAPLGPAIQQVSVDGALVPLVHGEWAEVKTLAVGTVTTRLDRDGHRVAQAADLSYFSRLADSETFTRLALGELHRRGTFTAGRVCGLADGAVWEQHFYDYHRPDTVRILDFAHAAEYVSAAAQAVFGPGAATTQAWLDDQLHTLKHADPEQVLAALQALPVERAAHPSEATTVRDTSWAYLATRREQIAYAAFQAQGYPIGSGAIESANKLVVEARLKGAGMHWARANVNPLVALRAAGCSDRWAEVWPAIGAHLQAAVAARRRRRAHSRSVVDAPPAAPVPAPPMPEPKPQAAEPAGGGAGMAVPREPLVVAGRPTAQHPWRRRFLPRRAAAS